jgi:AcrR family transcriptional regulator
MNTTQSHITEASGLLFSAQGIKITTMDQVANHCCISKKTLYHYFSDKEMLVTALVQSIIAKNEQIIRVVPGISPNAASELSNFFQYVQSRLDVLTPRLLRDVKKYYHYAYSLMIHSLNSVLFQYINQNICRGQSEDIYRSDLAANATGRLYCWQLHNAFEDAFLQDEKRHELVSCINSIFLHGIINARGLKLLSPHAGLADIVAIDA